MEDALERNHWMTPERKAFLKKRIPYWREWAKRKDKGSIDGDDHE